MWNKIGNIIHTKKNLIGKFWIFLFGKCFKELRKIDQIFAKNIYWDKVHDRGEGVQV